MGLESNAKRPATRSGSPRVPSKAKTFNAHTLEALKKSNQSEVVRRLIATVEQAWSELLDRTPPAPEATSIEEAEAAFASLEKVLVAVDAAGLVRVYAERWVAVRVVELRPWDEGDERLQWLAERFLGPYWESKQQAATVSRAPRTVDEALAWFIKVQTWNRFLEQRAAGTLPELTGA